MEYTTLGSTGLTVSRICLGCMSFGSSEWREWVMDEPEGRALLERAIDLGINFFDTANMYSMGESERVLGTVLGEYDRDRHVVATKSHPSMGPESYPPTESAGLSRKAIEQDLANSLDRLGMDTVDLYQTHRWDPETPIETTLRALEAAIDRGQVRHAGTSSMWAHQFATALRTADDLDIAGFETMQNHYNLLYREEEREMLPLCAKEGVGVIPWSPLARGYLARPQSDLDATQRGQTDEYIPQHPYLEGGGREINDRVAELAEESDASMAQIALAWLLHKEWVDAPIVGTTSIEHLEEAVGALDIDLSTSDIEWLEEPYEPVRVSGHE